MGVLEVLGLALGVLCSIITIFLSIVRPLLKLNTTLTELIGSIKDLKEDFTSYTTKNAKSHEKLWEHEKEQDDTLQNHEIRITLLQKQAGMEVEYERK